MCLFPRYILNKKYLPTKKNGFNPPPLTDLRLKYVPVGCGKCIECMKQKAREWKVRLNEEIKVSEKPHYVTLTFSNHDLEKLCKETGLKETNAVATIAVRRFLERWRKKYKKSIKHWLITELGHENTERIHLHGIIFSDILTEKLLTQYWSYGQIRIGQYCNERTINYIMKYVTKIDTDHKNYFPVILCSKGLGANYIKEFTKQLHRYNGKNTIEYYRLPNGNKCNLPIYYRNKFFNEEERENLWINLIEKGTRYVLGIEINNIDTTEGQKKYYSILKKAQEDNKNIGFGDDTKTWRKMDYNVTLRMLNKVKKNRR